MLTFENLFDHPILIEQLTDLFPVGSCFEV